MFVVEHASFDWTGIAALITSVGVVLIGLGQLWLKRDTKQINKAVNHVADGPSLIEMITADHKLGVENRADIVAVVDMVAENQQTAHSLKSCMERQATKLDEHIAESRAEAEASHLIQRAADLILHAEQDKESG